MVDQDVYLDAGLRGWIANKARKEHWRMASWYSVDDLIQDGYCAYLKCRNKYALQPPQPGHSALNTQTPTKDQRRHFMSLVQRAFTNHIMTLAGHFAESKEELLQILPNQSLESAFERVSLPEPEAATIAALLATLPTELVGVLNSLMQDGQDAGGYLRSRLRLEQGRLRKSRHARRETTEEYWSRVLEEPDLVEKLVDFLAN